VSNQLDDALKGCLYGTVSAVAAGLILYCLMQPMEEAKQWAEMRPGAVRQASSGEWVMPLYNPAPRQYVIHAAYLTFDPQKNYDDQSLGAAADEIIYLKHPEHLTRLAYARHLEGVAMPAGAEKLFVIRIVDPKRKGRRIWGHLQLQYAGPDGAMRAVNFGGIWVRFVATQ
jgi:hypothetical protein